MPLSKKNLASQYYRKNSMFRRNVDGLGEFASMADLAFLLLIFFIVTASFVLRQGVFLSLPTNAASVKVDAKNLLEVYPENQGYTVEGKIIQRSELLKLIGDRKQLNKDTIMVIYMRPNIPYDRLVDTLSAAKEKKLNKISLKDYK